MTAEIPIRNIYYLYAYAWDQFRFVRRVSTGEEDGPDAVPFFAEFSCKDAGKSFGAASIALIRHCRRSFLSCAAG